MSTKLYQNHALYCTDIYQDRSLIYLAFSLAFKQFYFARKTSEPASIKSTCHSRLKNRKCRALPPFTGNGDIAVLERAREKNPNRINN